MKVHQQQATLNHQTATVPASSTVVVSPPCSTILNTDGGLTVAILDDPHIQQEQQQSHFIMTSSSMQPTSSSASSPSSSSMLVTDVTIPTSSTAIQSNDIVQINGNQNAILNENHHLHHHHQHPMMQHHNHHQHTHGGHQNINLLVTSVPSTATLTLSSSTTTTTTTILIASDSSVCGGGGCSTDTNVDINGGVDGSGSIILDGSVSIIQCPSTAGSLVSLSAASTATTTVVHSIGNCSGGGSLDSNDTANILQVITPESQHSSQCFNDNSLSIDIKDAIFDDDDDDGDDDEDPDAYPDNNGGGIGNASIGGGSSIGTGGSQSNIGGGGGGAYAPLMPPAIGSNNEQTDLKYYFEELCPVCGDKVSGYHYGLLTCESCKGFFKRTVQNKKVYTCVAERQCHIDKTQRKRCPFCRFQKCLEVGMKLEAVRADRMRGGRNKFGPMYKRDRARKLQIMRQRQLALQALRASEGGVGNIGVGGSSGGSGSGGVTVSGTGTGSIGNQSQLSPTGYQQPYSHMNIKQEIQIPQISSLTSSSPDSSPSPIAIALGQVSAGGSAPSMALTGSGGSGGNGNNNGGNGNIDNATSPNGNGGNSGSGVSNGTSLGPGSDGGGGGGGVSIGGGGGNGGLGSTNSTASSLQSTATDSKLWFANSTTASPHSLSPKQFSFDAGTNPSSTEDTSHTVEPLSKKQYWKNSKSLNFPRVSPMIREFVQTVDDREWQTQLFSLLQSQSYNQCEVDLFELMCKVLDQNLFSQVDWARNTVFFKDLKVDDQMKLLQNSWSDMLVLDHLHQRIHNNLPDETTLPNGQKFDLLGLGLLGVHQLAEHFNEIQNKLVELKFDVGDYICMKFLLLLNPEVRGITNRKTVEEGYGNVQAALLDYTLTCYPSVTDKFSKLRSIIPEIHAMAAQGEEHLYIKHCAGNAPTQTLLMEMLHAKRK